MTLKYKCIIFDCDGVLVDSEPLSNQVMVNMANAYGANIDLQYAYKHFKGYYIENCIKKIEALTQKRLPDNFEAEYRSKSFEAFKNNIKPIEGITKVVKNLSIPFCVASSGPEHKIELNLKLTGLWPYFKGKIFSSYTINKWKPNPDVFIWASKTMGFKPNECIVIEDSITGVQAALAGGFDVFGYTAHDYNNSLETLATKTFNTMENLPKLLSI